MQHIDKTCPGCGREGLGVFYEVKNVPTNSVLLLSSQEEATDIPKGNIRLAVCPVCGFVTNVDFDAQLAEYSARYEATQGYSPTFNAFHKRLAQDLIDRYGLHGKDIIEIGCDKGDFLTLLCEMGNNRGVGFDPAYVSGRHPSPAADRLTFIADFYSEKYADYKADFIACKMTLEHISDTAAFVGTVRRSIGNNLDTIVFFQIPNATYVLQELAFWDVYYEHCSYFTRGSLAYLFRHVGFEVIEMWTGYDDQYLMIEARPGANNSSLPNADGIEQTMALVSYFEENVPQKLAAWRRDLQQMKAKAQKVVLWGGGSKGVAFLTTLGLGLDEVAYAVDINPHKTGTFMAGTGQEIVAPDFLKTYRPDVVIIMNPIYREEIGRDLEKMGLSPEIRTM